MVVAVKREFHCYVEKNKNKCGGEPIIKDTRIPVSMIIKHYKSGMSIEDILEGYPNLKPQHIFDALGYYYDNKEEIEKILTE